MKNVASMEDKLKQWKLKKEGSKCNNVPKVAKNNGTIDLKRISEQLNTIHEYITKSTINVGTNTDELPLNSIIDTATLPLDNKVNESISLDNQVNESISLDNQVNASISLDNNTAAMHMNNKDEENCWDCILDIEKQLKQDGIYDSTYSTFMHRIRSEMYKLKNNNQVDALQFELEIVKQKVREKDVFINELQDDYKNTVVHLETLFQQKVDLETKLNNNILKN